MERTECFLGALPPDPRSSLRSKDAGVESDLERSGMMVRGRWWRLDMCVEVNATVKTLGGNLETLGRRFHLRGTQSQIETLGRQDQSAQTTREQTSIFLQCSFWPRISRIVHFVKNPYVVGCQVGKVQGEAAEILYAAFLIGIASDGRMKSSVW